MEYRVDKVNRLFEGTTARKISIVSRLAGLTPEEIRIMRFKWLEGKSDIQICDEIGCSPSSLTRKRRMAHLKIMDALDLYGLSDLSNLQIEDIFTYEGMFYKAQDCLVKFFIRNNNDYDKQKELLSYLIGLTEK